MRRVKYALVIGLTLLSLGLSSTTRAATSYAPVTKFVSANSVLGHYFAHFVDRYGRNYDSKADTFRAFCRTLRESDILLQEFRLLRVSQEPVTSALHQLEQFDFARASREEVRRAMLIVDLTLESIESGIVPNHRSEFRREVLASTPPLADNG
ncbi:MAG: hypothetical protein HY696_05055 [Deltaproteobacteria bacterium]|nr:hypothetical protein [Deltaproteobacteria bacterium]